LFLQLCCIAGKGLVWRTCPAVVLQARVWCGELACPAVVLQARVWCGELALL